MESRLRILLLTVVLATLPGCATVRHWFHHRASATRSAAAGRQRDQPRTTTPRRRAWSTRRWQRRKITVPKIRSRNVEVGLDYGVLSIEDFGTHPVYGATAAYHITEDFFFQAEVGRATAGQHQLRNSERNIQLLTASERRFTYYDLSLGYNFLPGEAFIGRGHAMTSAFYLIGGIGGTDFAGDTKFTVNFGAGYRVVPTDWLAVHITVQDRVFQSDLLGTTKLTNNLEARIGTTVFF